MDTLTTLLAEARAAGLRLSVSGTELRIRGPRAAGGLVAQLRQQKAALVAHLRGEPAPEPPAAPVPEPPAAEPEHWGRRYVTVQEQEHEALIRFLLDG